jgi:hypothetical protein
MKGTEYFVSLTKTYTVMVNRKDLIGTTEYLAQQAKCHINWLLYLGSTVFYYELH